MTQLTIDSVRRDFKEWRSSRTGKAKIPDDLWDKTLKGVKDMDDEFPV